MSKYENDLASEIMKIFEALGWLIWRQNNLAAPGRKFVGRKGVSDLIALQPDGPSWWIECKDPKGKQSDYQISFQEDVEGSGHVYVLAVTHEDVLKVLQEREVL